MLLFKFTAWPHEDKTMLESLTHMGILTFDAETEITVLYIH